MASRYRAFSRAARNAFTSNGSTFTFRPARNQYRSQSQSQSAFRRNLRRNESVILRRRWAESTIPLHSAIAAAKLVSHLSFSSRSSRSALPLVFIQKFFLSTIMDCGRLKSKKKSLHGYIDILPVTLVVVP